jgi:hypothetical protein
MLVLKISVVDRWGLLVAAAVHAFKNLYQVVQYHRQLRRMAPGSLSGISSGPEGASTQGPRHARVFFAWRGGTERPSTNGVRVERPQLNWTTAKWGVPAGWLLLIIAGGIVVVPSGMCGIRVSQTAGTRPGIVCA